ncbi:MAG: hypothetical protein DRN04_02605 [Thermoprotei archaeon]|nr:MAG: hypothetical protein DRN04_02605 [Thermoprotei archaeon]
MRWDLERRYRITPFIDKIVELIVNCILELNNYSDSIQLDVTGHKQIYIGERIFKVNLIEKTNEEALLNFKVIYYFTDNYGYKRQAKPDDYIIKIIARKNSSGFHILIRQKSGIGRVTPEVICYYIDKKIAQRLKRRIKNLKITREN